MTGEFQGRVLGWGKQVGVQEDGERVRKRQAEGAKCQSVDHTFFCVVLVSEQWFLVMVGF